MHIRKSTPLQLICGRCQIKADLQGVLGIIKKKYILVSMISSTILLIHPPAASPMLPCWDAAVVAGSLSGSGFTIGHYDANLDFYRTHLFSKTSLLFYFQQIQKKRDSGQVSRQTYFRLKKLYEATYKTVVDMDEFKGNKFYDPQYFISCKNKIDSCLILASNTDICAHGNPFVLLCEQGLASQLDRYDPGTVIFFVSCQAQAVAARIMAAFIKEHYPGVRVVAMIKRGFPLPDTRYFDHLIWNQAQKGLVLLGDWVNQIHGVKMDLKNSLPDFRAVPLDQYLTPEKIILVYPLFFKDPFALSDFLEDQVHNLGVRGFVFVQASSNSDIDEKIESPGRKIQEKADQIFPGDICRHLAHWFSIKQPRVFFSIQVRTGELFPGYIKEMSDLFTAGLRLIHWQTDRSKISEKTLWEASKLGIWNHLSGSDLFKEQGNSDIDRIKFIANSPNIVHSFQDTNQDTVRDLTRDELFAPIIPPGFMDYAGVAPLPGIPFWQFLGDPGYLLVYLSQINSKSLGHLRVDLENNRVICLGRQILFTYQSPKELPSGVLEEICKMVEAGGSVDITHVRSNLEKAYMIGYAMENGVIIGNSSLKHPRASFIKRLKQMTGVDFTNFVERGYTSVRPEYRALGVGAKLLEGLTKRVKDYKVFSIISEENLVTQKIALRNNTKKILTYFSGKLNKQMGVWMPEHMIDNQGDNDK
ncbi:MAG: hypothetical protein GY710_10805 [Desulfobacteraceae bacterium]|nr:hypothetical protein [Desulfobacteraceae bacterium]